MRQISQPTHYHRQHWNSSENKSSVKALPQLNFPKSFSSNDHKECNQIWTLSFTENPPNNQANILFVFLNYWINTNTGAVASWSQYEPSLLTQVLFYISFDSLIVMSALIKLNVNHYSRSISPSLHKIISSQPVWPHQYVCSWTRLISSLPGRVWQQEEIQ